MNETNNPNNTAGDEPANLANRSGGTRTIQPLASGTSQSTPVVNVGTNYQNEAADDSSGFIDKPISVNPRYDGRKKPVFDKDEGPSVMSTIITILVVIIGVFQLLSGIAALFLEGYDEPYWYFFMGLQILIGLGLIFRIETARKVIVYINIILIALCIIATALMMFLPDPQSLVHTNVTRWTLVSPFVIMAVYFIIETNIISQNAVNRVFR